MKDTESSDLGFQLCGTCRQLAHQVQHPERYTATIPGELGVRMTRDSALLWFGTHVGEAHPTAIAPDLAPDTCAACRAMQIYLAVEGPGETYPDISGSVTSIEIVRRHRLSHLIDLLPETDVA